MNKRQNFNLMADHVNFTCSSCQSDENTTTENETIQEEEEEPSYCAIQRIWGAKMSESNLFMPTEVQKILLIWVKFIAQRCCLSACRCADEFYIETAEIVAQKLKHYSNHGWDCLVSDIPPKPPICIEIGDQELNPEENCSESSIQSLHDTLAQIKFLLSLVASSDFSLGLVRIAFHPDFKPKTIKIKSPHKFQMPRTYLHFDLTSVGPKKVRSNLLYGHYDDFILPLQMAKEVGEKFWLDLDEEYGLKEELLEEASR